MKKTKRGHWLAKDLRGSDAVATVTLSAAVVTCSGSTSQSVWNVNMTNCVLNVHVIVSDRAPSFTTLDTAGFRPHSYTFLWSSKYYFYYIDTTTILQEITCTSEFHLLFITFKKMSIFTLTCKFQPNDHVILRDMMTWQHIMLKSGTMWWICADKMHIQRVTSEVHLHTLPMSHCRQHNRTGLTTQLSGGLVDEGLVSHSLSILL